MNTSNNYLDTKEKLIVKEIFKIADELQKELSIKISKKCIQDVIYHCYRKMNIIKKPIDYLPLLFKCELKNYINVQTLNNMSKFNTETSKGGAIDVF